jgi:hypothetical protein
MAVKQERREQAGRRHQFGAPDHAGDRLDVDRVYREQDPSDHTAAERTDFAREAHHEGHHERMPRQVAGVEDPRGAATQPPVHGERGQHEGTVLPCPIGPPRRGEGPPESRPRLDERVLLHDAYVVQREAESEHAEVHHHGEEDDHHGRDGKGVPRWGVSRTGHRGVGRESSATRTESA